jgi:hypothetical protein
MSILEIKEIQVELEANRALFVNSMASIIKQRKLDADKFRLMADSIDESNLAMIAEMKVIADNLRAMSEQMLRNRSKRGLIEAADQIINVDWGYK